MDYGFPRVHNTHGLEMITGLTRVQGGGVGGVLCKITIKWKILKAAFSTASQRNMLA